MLSWPIKGMVICSSRNQYAWLVMNSGSPVHQPGKLAPRFTLRSYFNPIYVPLPHIHSLYIKYKLIFKLLLFNHFLTLKYTLKYTKIHFLIWLLLWILPGLPQWFSSVQFSSVAQSCPTLCDPRNCSTPGLPVHHQLPESTQTHVHWVGDAIQPSYPLSSPSPLWLRW